MDSNWTEVLLILRFHFNKICDWSLELSLEMSLETPLDLSLTWLCGLEVIRIDAENRSGRTNWKCWM